MGIVKINLAESRESLRKYGIKNNARKYGRIPNG